MFVVTIEQAVDDDFFGHWINHAIYILDPGTFGSAPAKQAMYEALYRWIKDKYHGSARECIIALAIGDNSLRVIVYYGISPGTMRQVWSERFIPLDLWGSGRTVSCTPVHCAICDWYGTVRQMIHGYRLNSQAETEPVDLCPRCGATPY